MNNKNSLIATSIYQAVGLALYCGLVAMIFWQGENWFGKMDSFWGPMMFLVLFVVSGLISGLLTLGYPIYLIWHKKDVPSALKLIGLTSIWLVLLIVVILTIKAVL